MTVTVTFSFATEAEAAKFLAGKGGASTGTSTGTGTSTKTETKTDTKKSTKSKAEVTAALNEVKDKFGAPVAKALIKDVGKAEKLDLVAEENYDALYDAAKKKMEEDEGM